MISGFSGLPKFRQLVAPIGTAAGARDVARRLGDREHRAPAWIEVAVAGRCRRLDIASARVVPLTRTTPAPMPASTSVLVRTMWSYWR